MEESCFFIYVNLNGLRANRNDEMEMYLFVHKDLFRAVNSDRDLATLFCVHMRAYTWYIIYFFLTLWRR